MPPLELALFDMDGVLADTEPIHLAASQRLLAEEGFELTAEINRDFLGHTDRDFFAALIRRYGLRHPVEYYVERKTAAVIATLRDDGLAPNPGVVEALLRLGWNGVQAVVASSSAPDVIDAVVGATGLRRSFAGLYSASMVERGKPAPDLFRFAASHRGVAPAGCLVIEDAPAGIAAARAAGMRVIGIRTESAAGADLSAADRVLDSLEQFVVDEWIDG